MFRIHLFRDLAPGAPFFVYGAVDGSPALVNEKVIAISPHMGEGLTYDYDLDPTTGMVVCYKHGTDKALIRLRHDRHIVVFIPMDAPVLTIPGRYDVNAVNKIANQLSPTRVDNNLANIVPAPKIPYEGIEATLATPSRLKTEKAFWAEALPLKPGDLLSDRNGNVILVTDEGPKVGSYEAVVKVSVAEKQSLDANARGFNSTDTEPADVNDLAAEMGKLGMRSRRIDASAAASPGEDRTKYSFGEALKAINSGQIPRMRNLAWADNSYIQMGADHKSYEFCVLGADETVMVRALNWSPTQHDMFGQWIRHYIGESSR